MSPADESLQLWIEGVEPALSVRRVSVREQLSDLFSLAIVACSPRPDLDLEAMLFRPASLTMVHRSLRSYTGLCASVEQVQAEPTGLSTYSLRLVPRLWLLTLRHNYRIFQHLSVPAILTCILDELSVVHAWRVDREAFPALEYKVQYGESDFAFLCRLCEDAGLSFFFEEGDEGTDEASSGTVLVISDAPCAAQQRRGLPLTYADNPNEAAEREFVTRVRLTHEGRTGAVALRDFDFRHPALSLMGGASRPEGLLEHFRYVPGAFRVVSGMSSATPVADRDGAARHDPIIGRGLAERVLHSEHAGAHGISFETNALDLAPGAVFSVASHPHPQLDERRRLLVTHFALDAEHDKAWRAQGKAVFGDRPYAPPRVTPRPVVHGLESAVVTGPLGREIFTDEHGRVRVRFPWDREDPSDAKSSCWIRVSQGWAGAGYGLWTAPRVGQEVLVGFLGGNPDEPIIVGRAPNALNPPPYPLPANESKTVWRSQSTPGGEGYNEISFEDMRGQERVYERAERDKESLVRNDERNVVGHDRSRLVKGDENILIGGSRREQIGGSLHQTMDGEHRAEVGGAVSSIVGGDRQEQVGGRYAVQSGEAMHFIAGGSIVIEAADITLKAGGGFVRITAGGVTTNGGWAMIQPGAPCGGAGSDPAEPEKPAMAAASFPGLPVPAPSVRRLPVLGFPGVGMALTPGVDPERSVICEGICACKDVRTDDGLRRNPEACLKKKLWFYDDALNNQSTIKAQTPYDMSKIPPAPIMSRNNPKRATRQCPKGSRIPDIVLVKDGSKPPTQDNIKKVIEVKFPPTPKMSPDQEQAYRQIAGAGVPVEEWTPDTCGCEGKKQPKPVPVPSKAAEAAMIALLMVAIAALIVDDLVGGEADDPLIPALVRRLMQMLGPTPVPAPVP